MKRCDELGPFAPEVISMPEIATVILPPGVERTGIGHGTQIVPARRDCAHTPAEESRDDLRDATT
jgi:hypothetical protein